MIHHYSVGGGTYRHPFLRCRVVKPREVRSVSSGFIGWPWLALFSLVRELRSQGYAVHSVYRVSSNNWLVITEEGWV